MDVLLSPQLLDNAAIVLTLVVLEGLLSADNALVLAVMVKHLPEVERGHALRYGLLGAFIFRAVGVLLAQYLIRIWYLKALGAGWLFFLALKHFYSKYRAKNDANPAPAAKPRSFWMTVFWVECMDIAFSLVSILAAVAMSSNIYIVWLGGILGIITMRLVAGVFLKLLDKFQGLEASAYLIVAWIGIKLSTEVIVSLGQPPLDGAPHHADGIPKWLFWAVMGLLFVSGLIFHPKSGGGVGNPPEQPA